MNESHLRVLGLAAMLSVSGAAPSPPQAGGAKVEVRVADIGEGVTLVGRLGVPLGEMTTVTGTWGYPKEVPKDSSLRFRVVRINDKQLTQPVEFHVEQVDAVFKGGKRAVPEWKDQGRLDGVTWTLRAYETGRFDREPEEWLDESGQAPAQRPGWTETFTSEVVGVVTKADG